MSFGKKIPVKIIGSVVVIFGAILSIAQEYVTERKIEEMIDEKLQEREASEDEEEEES